MDLEEITLVNRGGEESGRTSALGILLATAATTRQQ